MKCISCGAINPPSFIHCIQNNICGGCGGSIMDESAKKLMDELSEAMLKMPNDPQGIAGWLLSNYECKKIGEATPVEKFHRKKTKEEANYDNLKKDNSYEDFLKRTDAYNNLKNNPSIEKLKKVKGSKMAQLAQNISSIDDSLEDDVEDINIEDKKAYKALKASGLDPFSNEGGVIKNPSQLLDKSASENIFEDNIFENNEEELTQEKELSRTVEGMAILEKNRFKKIKAQEAVFSGNGKSAFRR